MTSGLSPSRSLMARSSSLFRVSSIRRLLTRSHLWRLGIAFLMIVLYTLTSWSTLVSPASAASQMSSLPQLSQQDYSPGNNRPPRPSAHSSVSRATTPNVSSSTPFDGLGDLSFYTYITIRINDRVELKVNVANGNLLAHTSDLHIRGTGIDETLDGYYNAQANFSGDHGNNWNVSFGHDVRLDLSNPTQGITLHGPSGYSAFFAYTNGSYTDAPGLNATLVKNGDGTYTLTFHRTGEKWNFGTNSHLASDQDKNGNTISYSYNSSHDLLSLTDSQGRVTTFTHTTVSGFTDPSGQITSFTDPSGRTVQYGYNQNGNPTNSLTSITDALGKVTTFTYSGSDLTSVTDPRGNTTTISYLTGDKVGSITDATGNGTMTFTYNSGNTVFTDKNGHTTTYTYNAQLQVTKTTDALGHSSTTSYDASNYNMIQYGDALGDLTTFTFSTDGRNNLNSVQDGNGATTSFGYPSSGNNLYSPLTQTDAQGNVTTYAYDSNGNMLSATNNQTGKGLTYTYNSNGTVATMKDGNGNVTSFGYDSKGNLTSVTPPSPLGGEVLTVDAQTSRVTSVTDGKGQKTSYIYDNLDRLKTISYAGGATITYSYDGNSNLTSEVDNTGTTSFVYDVLNRITKKTLPGGTVITTGYDKQGNLTSFTDGSGTTTYTYDAANRMTVLAVPGGAQTTYGYDNANHKTSISYPNGTGMLMTYDKAGHELTSKSGVMSGGTLTTLYSSFSSSYLQGSTQRAVLQSVSLLDPVSQSATYTRTYTYDSQNRLTDATVTNNGMQVEDWKYGYDHVGNRTSYSVLSSGENVSYSYNAANELTTKVDGATTTTYTYDANGNQTGSTGGPSFTYNTKNQTTAIGSDSYTYSGPDQRDRVTVNSDTFVYSGLGLSSQTSSGGTTYYTRCSCGLLNSEQTPDGKRYYYLFDGLGSIVGLTDSTGSEVNAYDYDPYGNMLNQKEGVTNPWKYAGGYFDSSTSLYKFGVRYYNPTLGRWTQQDPVGGSLGDLNAANRYTYANDDPVNMVDQSGQSIFSFLNCLGGWLAGITAIVGFATIVFAASAAIVGAIATLNPLIGMFIFMATVLGAALALGAFGVNTYDTIVAPPCGYALLT